MPTDRQWLDSLKQRPLDQDIDLSKFRCSPNIDWFLTNVGLEMHRRRLTYVTCWLNGGDLAGYAATSMTTVELIRPEQRRRLGVLQKFMPTGAEMKRYPAMLIGMLGTCDRYQRRGLGREMVLYAIGQAEQLSQATGCRFVTVDSDKTDEAIGLYNSCAFEQVEQKDAAERQTVWMVHNLGDVPE